MDVLIAPLAYPETPILNSTESRTGVPELTAIAAEIADGKSTFRGRTAIRPSGPRFSQS